MADKEVKIGQEVDGVIPTVPGTILGGHDVHGTDGEERTERSGELLGTPAPEASSAKHTEDSREKETAKADFVREEVDRANREELPKLGGNTEDAWEAPRKAAPKA